MPLPPPNFTLFPYTTLFRSLLADAERLQGLGGGAPALADEAEQDVLGADVVVVEHPDRKSTHLNSSHVSISYAVFCLKKKNFTRQQHAIQNNINSKIVISQI